MQSDNNQIKKALQIRDVIKALERERDAIARDMTNKISDLNTKIRKEREQCPHPALAKDQASENNRLIEYCLFCGDGIC